MCKKVFWTSNKLFWTSKKFVGRPTNFVDVQKMLDVPQKFWTSKNFFWTSKKNVDVQNMFWTSKNCFLDAQKLFQKQCLGVQNIFCYVQNFFRRPSILMTSLSFSMLERAGQGRSKNPGAEPLDVVQGPQPISKISAKPHPALTRW